MIIDEENGVRWLKMESKIEQRGTRNAWTCLQILSHSVENCYMKNYKALGSNMLRMMGQIWKYRLFHQLYSMRIIFNDHIFCVFTEWSKKISTILNSRNSNHAEIRSFLPIPSPKNIYLWLILLDFFLSFLWPTAMWQVSTTCTTSGVPRGPQLLRRRWILQGVISMVISRVTCWGLFDG